MTNPFAIKSIDALQILDSRGNPTIRAIVCIEQGICEFGDAPAGASRGTREAVELRDTNGYVTPAINAVKYEVSKALEGFDVRDQRKIDKLLIEIDGTPNKSRIGGNTTIAISIATAKTASKALGMEYFEYIGGKNATTIPIPLFNIINGGKHAGNKLKIQEFIVIPVKFDKFSEALFATAKVYKALKDLITERYGKIFTALGDEGGYSPPLEKTEDALDLLMAAIRNAGYDNEFYVGMDAAASEFFNEKDNVYEIDDKKISRDELLDFYVNLAKTYPLLYLEDPFNENDFEGFSILKSKLKNVIVTGDDLYTTNVKYLSKGIELNATSGTIVKPNQIGTLSETLDFCKLAKLNNIKLVVSHRSGETEDSFVADLAVGVGSEFIKTGAPARGERTSKYNRLLEIEKYYDMEYMGKKLSL